MKRQLLILLFALPAIGFSQGSNILEYTPSKLLRKGQIDIKWFNNLYTESFGVDENRDRFDFDRRYFFTSNFEVMYGLTENKRVNVGLIANFRSTLLNSPESSYGFSDLIQFGNETGISRSGLSAIAPTIRYSPKKVKASFSIQSSFFIPLIDKESEGGVYLDKKSFVWETRLFYDKTFRGKYQLFLESGGALHLGEELDYVQEIGGYANNSFNLPVSAFFSYFINSKSTIYAMTQHAQLIPLGNDFAQNFTQSGLGAKWQFTPAANLELLYTNFWRGNSTGLGETFNVGLRVLVN